MENRNKNIGSYQLKFNLTWIKPTNSSLPVITWNQKFELKVEMQIKKRSTGFLNAGSNQQFWEPPAAYAILKPGRKVIIIHPVLASFIFTVKQLIIISTLLHLFLVICRSTVELEVVLDHLAMQLAW